MGSLDETVVKPMKGRKAINRFLGDGKEKIKEKNSAKKRRTR
jgi:hypothetical protein